MSTSSSRPTPAQRERALEIIRNHTGTGIMTMMAAVLQAQLEERLEEAR
jgi:hypothetical protein